MAKAKAKFTPGLNGATLRRIRDASNVSASELSQRLGKHRSWASKIESQDAPIKLVEAKRIMEILEVGPEAFGLDASAKVLKFSADAMMRRLESRQLRIPALAKLLGTHPTVVYRWIHQAAQPDKRHIELLCETLECEASDLYIDADSGPPRLGEVENQKPDDHMVCIRMSRRAFSAMRSAIEAVEGGRVEEILSSSVQNSKAIKEKLQEALHLLG